MVGWGERKKEWGEGGEVGIRDGREGREKGWEEGVGR